jgi:hypothetical protein
MLLAFGLAIAGVGMLWMKAGVQVQAHWTGQPMFSWGLVASGALCMLLALVPASWITKAATARSKAHR